MNNAEHKNKNGARSVREKVLDAIHGGRVLMRPRWHFILHAALAAAGAVLVFLTLLYLASFAVFVLRRSGAWFVPAFGARGWFALLASLPWMLLAASAVFVVVLELLVRHYAFAYRRPLLYSVLGILLFVFVGGYVVARTPFHGRMMRYMESHGVLFAGRWYREFGAPRFREIYRGEVGEIATSSFMLRYEGGETVLIMITPQTRLPFGADFREGDSVVVFGPRADDAVQAFGVRRVLEDAPFPFPGPREMHPPLFP